MDFFSNLLPPVPSLELNPTSPYQNVTLLQNVFITTFLSFLGFEAVRNILGEGSRTSRNKSVTITFFETHTEY